MAFRLKRSEPIFDGVRRVAGEQMARAFAELDDNQLSSAKKVHQVRKRCKKLRGLVRLVRPGFDSYKEENTWFRDTGRMLSSARDSKVMLDAYEHVVVHAARGDDRERFHSIRKSLQQAHDQLIGETIDLEQKLEAARSRLEQAQLRIADWSWSKDEQDVLWSGLSRAYSRARRSMPASADPASPDRFHDWRRHVKYHWYHLRLLSNAWRAVFDATADRAQEVGDNLGVDHDLSVLHDRLARDPTAYGDPSDVSAFGALIQKRRAKLERRSLKLGRLLFCEKPSRLVKRWQCYWQGNA